MESALVRADLDHPGVLPARDVGRLRYLLGFARLHRFQPGAAKVGRRTSKEEVDLEDDLAAFRTLAIAELRLALRTEKNPQTRLRAAAPALGRLAEPLERERQAIQLQMTTNAPYADWVLRIEPTLSPLNLVPSPEQVDQSIEWGCVAIEEQLPMIKRFLEPARWD